MGFTSLTSPDDVFELTNMTEAVSTYASPSPPAGAPPHRYIFALYVQPTSFANAVNPFAPTIDNTTSRRNFTIESFAKQFELGDPSELPDHPRPKSRATRIDF